MSTKKTNLQAQALQKFDDQIETLRVMLADTDMDEKKRQHMVRLSYNIEREIRENYVRKPNYPPYVR